MFLEYMCGFRVDGLITFLGTMTGLGFMSGFQGSYDSVIAVILFSCDYRVHG